MNRSDFEELYAPPEHELDRNSAPKQKKIKENAVGALEIDRISELPDSILVHILSLIPDTESAIRTGILSKRWQFLWTSLPVLSFSFDRKYITNMDLSVDDFIFFVDKTLIQCNRSELKKLTFGVATDRLKRTFPSLKAWIRYAVSCNVKELEVSVPYDETFELPLHLFTNMFLTNLKLRSCLMAPSGQISWKILKKLSVWHSTLNEELIQSILLGTPMLVYLELGYCKGFTQLVVNSKGLQELVVDGYMRCFDNNDNDIILKISGPTIWSLEIKGDLDVDKIALSNLPSLVKANLDFYRDDDGHLDDRDMWNEIFENISHAKELTIGYFAIEVLSSLELDGRPSPLSKRTCLEMSFIRRSCFPGLANLLQSSPCLERLIINYPSSGLSGCGRHTKRNYLTYQKKRFDCMQRCLKFVKICYLLEYDAYRECELGRFLLENSSVLEKMIINVGSAQVLRDQPAAISEFLSEAIVLQESRKYASFSRASKEAVILIDKVRLRESTAN